MRILKPGGVIYIDHEVNPNYWKQDPLEVAKEGIEKMKACVREALG